MIKVFLIPGAGDGGHVGVGGHVVGPGVVGHVGQLGQVVGDEVVGGGTEVVD